MAPPEFGGGPLDAVLGTVVNPAGLILAKLVPAARAQVFAGPGLGASPTWHGFAAGPVGIAFTDTIGVVGDERIRIDLEALRVIDDHLAWAPGGFHDRDGRPAPGCPRGVLGRLEAALAAAGLGALVGHEIEFTLVGPGGEALPGRPWAPYGAAGLLEHETFAREVLAAAAAAGVQVEQFHPEYGVNQFEMSLAPGPPVAAADELVLARIVIGRVARRHGLRVSWSPAPFAGGAGTGAHQHFSLARGAVPLFSGGTGPQGLTDEGGAAIGGVVDGLLEAQLVLCGSAVSFLRMRPGNWAGAYTCWGTENREAAVRLVPAGPGSPRGANVEVKVIDPSANPYLATAAVLGLALDGVGRGAALPPEIGADPQNLPPADLLAAGATRLAERQADAIAALAGSRGVRSILGDAAVDATLAVRRYEHGLYSDLDAESLADVFRMAWSV